MFKRVTLFILVLLLSASFAFAQTVSLTPYYVSPEGVKADTVGNPKYTGLFNRAYNGLLNVGVETQMYFKGMVIDANLNAPAWNVVSRPYGSVATFGAPLITDTSTQVVIFTPDKVGKYVLEFSDYGVAASVTVNAGLYLGIQDGLCNFCHRDQANAWVNTGHKTFFERAIKGQAGSYYVASCISCHTTGYDVNAKNNGFDDRTFVFPKKLGVAQWDSLLMKYPDAMKLATIGCESCHGPASEHRGITSDSKIVTSLEVGTCALCHDDGHYHVYPSQWELSGHAHLPEEENGTRTTCSGCHNGAQFIQFVRGETITLQPKVNITCAVCHDPHSAANEYHLRTLSATLTNGTVVNDGGSGKLCMNCHKSRREANSYTEKSASRFGPHYGVQADMLMADNVVTFGKKLPTSPHLVDCENSCVDCHMYEAGAHGEHDAEGDLTSAGMHSFSMVSKKGKDNVAACSPCHGDVGESFSEKLFYYNGVADHDGDGKQEGLQEEVHGLMEKLGSLLPNPDPHADPNNTWTKTELKASFNHRMVENDGSFGIHNPAFTVALLKVSIEALVNKALDGNIVAIEDVPNDQGKQVRIIWGKFVDDGTAVDPIASYTVKRDDGDDTWTGVGEHTADGSVRYALVVPTLYDSTATGFTKTTFKVVAISRSGMVFESKPATGYSVDNLVPQAPVNTVALLANGDVNLGWEAPADPDINYYQVFRSIEAAFEANETTLIGATTDLKFVDSALNPGDYYYQVRAVDFSGNLGELSSTVNVTVTSVAENGNLVPIRFALSQNYPNPFNPVTRINFSLMKAGHASLTVYNTLGQIVSVLVDKEMSAGNYVVSFSGDGMPSGEYFYRIEVKGQEGVLYNSMQKMILMK